MGDHPKPRLLKGRRHTCSPALAAHPRFRRHRHQEGEKKLIGFPTLAPDITVEAEWIRRDSPWQVHNLGPRCGTFNGCFPKRCATGASDTQLLGRFASNRDEAAFAAIMARHGPMVMTVCQGVLRDSPDAEDAFQATFLVLASKASSAWTEGQLGGWLHRVAYRIAVRASIDRARRQRCERRAAEVSAMRKPRGHSDEDVHPALHEELARLPAKLRAPLVLCYLEGQTHAQAALELRCGEATLRRRLAEARQRLRSRLVRRGFAPAASAAVLSMAGEAKAAPSAVAEATLRAAVRVAAGEAVAVVAGTRKAGLTRAGLKVLTKGWKTTAYAVVAVAAIAGVGSGIGVLGVRNAGGSTRAGTEAPRHPQAQAVAEASARKTGSRKHSIQGTVLAPDGKPHAGATVFWVGQPRPEPIALATPLTLKDRPVDLLKILARASSDAQGRFELTAEFDAHSFPGGAVVVKATDAGVSGRTFFNYKVSEGAENDQRLTIRLRKTVTIEGRLLAASARRRRGSRCRSPASRMASMNWRATGLASRRSLQMARRWQISGQGRGSPTTTAASGSKESFLNKWLRDCGFAIPISRTTTCGFPPARRRRSGCAG